MQMNLTEEEIEQITQIEKAQSILFPHLRTCIREFGPYITQYALAFFLEQVEKGIEDEEKKWKSRGNPA